ncbi:MAG: ABC transporter substrate-binding protein [Magnetococcales bacterium]|nr:ABC transporter substrate-binding protein [Magnetococcales bacterium]
MNFCLWLSLAQADEVTRIPIKISVPGPRNLSYLPVDLIVPLGADRAEGLEVILTYTGGGGVALQQMANGTSDCAVAGMPAHLSLKARGGEIVTLAAVNDDPLFVLMVHSDLAGIIRTPADLRGHVVGVNSSSVVSKTTSQQLAELILKNDGLDLQDVKIVPAGQSWQEQSTAIISHKVDAIMGDEPFASRLQDEGKVFFLVNLADPATTRRLPGGNFLHAALACRPDTVKREPEKIKRLVAVLRRVLTWITAHPPEQLVTLLGVDNQEERRSLTKALKKYPNMYSKDGKFSTRQIQETQTFFRNANSQDPAARALVVESMVEDRWAGRRD